MLKNKRVRSEMGKYGITQTKMSELMGESVPTSISSFSRRSGLRRNRTMP